MTRWRHFLAQTQEIALGIDGTLNAVAGMLSFFWSLAMRRDLPKLHYAEETISAHLHRRQQEGTVWGRLLAPTVNLLFALFQRDERGRVIRDHCRRAYEREMNRYYLPPEYRTEVKRQSDG